MRFDVTCIGLQKPEQLPFRVFEAVELDERTRLHQRNTAWLRAEPASRGGMFQRLFG